MAHDAFGPTRIGGGGLYNLVYNSSVCRVLTDHDDGIPRLLDDPGFLIDTGPIDELDKALARHWQLKRAEDETPRTTGGGESKPITPAGYIQTAPQGPLTFKG